MIGMIMEKTGLSWNEIMWKRSWINIEMMLADGVKMVKKNKGGVKESSGREMAARHREQKG